MRAGGEGSRPRRAKQVTDLPEPDSPTMPTVDPLGTERETPDTARTMPFRVWNETRRLLTSRMGMGPCPVEPGSC